MEHCWQQDPNDRPTFALVVDAIKSFQRVSNDESDIHHDRKKSVDDLSPEEKERMKQKILNEERERIRAEVLKEERERLEKERLRKEKEDEDRKRRVRDKEKNT